MTAAYTARTPPYKNSSAAALPTILSAAAPSRRASPSSPSQASSGRIPVRWDTRTCPFRQTAQVAFSASHRLLANSQSLMAASLFRFAGLSSRWDLRSAVSNRGMTAH